MTTVDSALAPRITTGGAGGAFFVLPGVALGAVVETVPVAGGAELVVPVAGSVAAGAAGGGCGGL